MVLVSMLSNDEVKQKKVRRSKVCDFCHSARRDLVREERIATGRHA